MCEFPLRFPIALWPVIGYKKSEPQAEEEEDEGGEEQAPGLQAHAPTSNG
jgi:hypothetical protein